MKKKITIALDENILARIDADVDQNKAKNRSAAIESHLIKYYGDFTDASAIIFAHDEKWDNREYPFDEPKMLLKVRWESIIARQIIMFLKEWISDIHISVPVWMRKAVKEALNKRFPQQVFSLYEMDTSVQTGDALRVFMNTKNIGEKLFISNGDIFFWDLDIKQYYKFHKKHGADFSFSLKFVMTPEQLGNVVIQWEKIIAFVEKPQAKATYLTNSGLYITTKSFLEKNDFWSHLETDFFPYIPNSSNVIGYLYSGEWEHIQNDSTLERVNGELL